MYYNENEKKLIAHEKEYTTFNCKILKFGYMY